ncbi:LysR family transcriptional regulator [Paenibacillus caui]|uniref:LysR family transcriptional regulator n=1 Tax=Paenibacillus caui TaxID=2873927 RepID=UPI001CA8765F|nr:LysR family transcriptional regulator [Paenibacillus caui]
MIDFEWYRSFISVYKHGSVSAAAKARFLTQPAMSQHVAALEAEVGEPLFHRAPRQMIPTDKGKELYTAIAPVIEQLESMTLELKHASASTTSAPVVRIGSASEYFGNRALGKIKRLNVRLSVRFGVAQALMDSLQKDEVELIITSQKLPYPGIEYMKIEDEQFVVTAPFHYPIGGSEGIEGAEQTEAWLSRQNWLSYGLELPIIRRYWREHFGRRPQLRPDHIIPDLRIILDAIEQGMGISILPAYLIEESLRQKKTKVLFPHLSVKNTIYAACKRENKGNPVVKRIVEVLKEEEAR